MDIYIKFETDCKQMFVGQIIRGIIYGELKYFMDENGVNHNPKPFYQTKYHEIDSLDYSIYFRTDCQTIYITWDNAFFCYGLKSELIELNEETNAYEQKWDVSGEPGWTDCIGEKIIDFKIKWESSVVYKKGKIDKSINKWPQLFEIKLENGMLIFVSAAELKDGEVEYYSGMDNLLITLNQELLMQLVSEEKKLIAKTLTTNSFWRRKLNL